MNQLKVITDAVVRDLIAWDERDEADFIGISTEQYETLLQSDYNAIKQLERDRVKDIYDRLDQEQIDHYYHLALNDASRLTDTLHLLVT